MAKDLHHHDRWFQIRLGLAFFVAGLLITALLALWVKSLQHNEHADRTTIERILHQEASCPAKGSVPARCSALLQREVTALTPKEKAAIVKAFEK